MVVVVVDSINSTIMMVVEMVECCRMVLYHTLPMMSNYWWCVGARVCQAAGSGALLANVLAINNCVLLAERLRFGAPGFSVGVFGRWDFLATLLAPQNLHSVRFSRSKT